MNKPDVRHERPQTDDIRRPSPVGVEQSGGATFAQEPDWNRDALGAEFTRVRGTTLALAHPLTAEDCQVQSIPDASPTKWHLAHVAWFFETFVL